MFLLSKAKDGITEKEIRERFSDADIFQYFLGYRPELLKYYKSPFRKDSQAGCRFEYYNNQLWFVENAAYKNRLYWDCFSLGKELTGKKLTEILFDIYQTNPNKQRFELAKITNKFVCEIKIETIPWKKDNYFTKNFDISVEFLSKEPIFEFQKYWGNTKKNKVLTPNIFGNHNTQIAYYFPHSKHLKLYFPEVDKDGVKWYSNCDNEDLFNWHNIHKFDFEDKTLYVTKSGKDCLILYYHLNLPIIAVQQENPFLPDKILEFAKENKYKIVLIYDNSETDKPKVQKIIDRYPEINISSIFYPDDDTKDTAEYYKKYGLENLKKFYNEIR